MKLMKPLFLIAIAVSLSLTACTPAPAQPSGEGSLSFNDQLGQEWKLVSYGTPGQETALPADSEITLTFDQEGRAGGSAGCNSYGGEYQVDGQKIAILNVASTLMACDNPLIMQTESAYLAALGSAETFQLSSDQLEINYQGGVLVFEK